MDELWNITRVAACLGVTERTVYNKVRSGQLPAVKVGRLWRVRPADLEAWLGRDSHVAPSGAVATSVAEPGTAATAVTEPGAVTTDPGDVAITAVAEPGAIPTRAQLEALLTPLADELERRLVFVGLLSAGIEALGWPAPVVVGGHAVEYYTAGSYATVDIDLAGASEPVGQVLDSWSFQHEGRRWFDEALALVIEVPGSSLAPDQMTHAVVVRIGAITVSIIGIEDLVIDRLAACVHWNHAESCEWAVRLLKAAAEIDTPYLKARADDEHVADGLEVALRGAGLR